MRKEQVGGLPPSTGSYTVTGNHIDYVDDTAFTATGDVSDGAVRR